MPRVPTPTSTSTMSGANAAKPFTTSLTSVRCLRLSAVATHASRRAASKLASRWNLVIAASFTVLHVCRARRTGLVNDGTHSPLGTAQLSMQSSVQASTARVFRAPQTTVSPGELRSIRCGTMQRTMSLVEKPYLLRWRVLWILGNWKYPCNICFAWLRRTLASDKTRQSPDRDVRAAQLAPQTAAGASAVDPMPHLIFAITTASGAP